MDLNKAILYAKLVNAAYSIYEANPADVTSHAGDLFPDDTKSHKVIASIFANDLATDMHPERGDQRVPIGLILQAVDDSGEVVVAIRGTEGIHEWIHDAQFLPTPCPFDPGVGHTEDGFTDMYKSMLTGTDAKAIPVVADLPQRQFPKEVKSLVICGHSLGGALATMLALDVAVNAVDPKKFNFPPTVYTYASPRTGDESFVNIYNHAVPNTFRIANRVDLVPKLPLPPLYEHVEGLFDLSSVTIIPPKFLIKPEIACQHILTSYLHLLSMKVPGGPILDLKGECKFGN